MLYDHILIPVAARVLIRRVLSVRDVLSDMSRPGLVCTVTGAKPEHRRETVKTRRGILLTENRAPVLYDDKNKYCSLEMRAGKSKNISRQEFRPLLATEKCKKL